MTWKNKKKKKAKLKTKLLTLAAAAGAGTLAVNYGISQTLSDLAFDRKPPLVAKLLDPTGAKKDPDFTARRKQAAEDLLQMPAETVTVQSFDGLTLVGHLVPAPNPKRLIIAFHGWRSRWTKDFCLVAPFWHSQGCTVLYVEQRAQGSSQGKHMTFGLSERKDCLSWVRWAEERCPGLPIYLSGISMGATTVLMAAGEPLPPSVRGIQADCGFTDPKTILRHVARKNLHLSDSLLRNVLGELICRVKLHQGPGAYSTVTAMGQCRVPVLFVHGTADRFVPIDMTYENYLACAAPHRLLVVPGAGHGMSYAREPETCQKAMLDFWKDYDG